MPKNIKINLADCLGTSNKCGKVDEQRIWEFQRRLETIEAKPDNDNQLLSITDNKLSITNGNEVTLPVYDDTKLTEKVVELENRPQGSNQTLSLDGNILSISEGNSVTLPAVDASNLVSKQEFLDNKNLIDNQMVNQDNTLAFIVQQLGEKSNKADLDGYAKKSELPSPYDDTQVRELIKENSDKVDKVSQGLTTVGNRVSSVEGSITNLNETTTNNSKEIEVLKNKTDVFVSDMSFSREGDEVTLKYTRTDGLEKSVSFTDKDTKMVAYDDEPLKARVTALENKPDKDNQTLTLDGQTLSISGGNSVTVPQMVQWYPHTAWAEDINPVKNFTTKTSVSAPLSQGFYANYVGFCYTTSKEAPEEPTKYRWTRVSQVTELEKQLKELKEKGVSGTPQTLTIEGDTLSISGGNSVELPLKKNEVGLGGVKHYTLKLPGNIKREPLESRAYLSYNSSTNLGLIHLELIPTTDSYSGFGADVGNLPENAPKPNKLLEEAVIGFDIEGNQSKVATIYIEADGRIKGNLLQKGFRYIVNFSGYFS